MSFMQQLFTNILREGFGRWVVAHDNPAVYLYFLAALILSIALSVIICIRRHNISSIVGQFFAVLFVAGALYLLWLVFAWPIDRLPLWHAPASTDIWLYVIPARTVYTIIAITIHYVLALLISGTYGVAITLQLDAAFDLRSTPRSLSKVLYDFTNILFILVVPLLFTVLLGESRDVSVYWVTLTELGTVLASVWSVEDLLNETIDNALPLTTPTHLGIFKNFVRRRSARRFTSAIAYLLYFVGLLLIAYTHPFDHSVIGPLYQVCGLYLGLIWLDHVIAGVRGAFIDEKGDDEYLSPRRWIFTLPLTVAIGFLGATGAFQSWTGSAVIAPNLWAQAGAAAAAFMLFQPLVALARYTAGARETKGEDSDNLRALLNIVKGNFTSPTTLQRVASRVAPGLPPFTQPSAAAQTTPASPTALAPSAQAENLTQQTVQGTAEAQAQQVADMMYEAQQQNVNREQTKERYLFNELNFPTTWVFLGLLIAYHVLALFVNLNSGLNNLLITFVFGLITLVSGILNLLNNKVIRSASPVFLLLIFVISGVAAITALSALVPAVDTVPHAITFFLIMQQLLIFLTFGQLLYLYQLINATITVEQRDTRPPDVEGKFEFALALREAKENAAAAAAFLEAVKVDGANAEAMYHLSATYLDLSQLLDAERYAVRAIAIAEEPGSEYQPNLSTYYTGHGSVCMALEKYHAACAAFKKALEYHASDIKSLMDIKRKYAEALRKVGRTAEADAMDLDIENDAASPAVAVAAAQPPTQTTQN